MLFTTIGWYYRLTRATQDPAFNGRLSAAPAALSTRRPTLPVLRRLDAGRRLNFLTAERSSSRSIAAGIRVTTESPLLAAAAEALDIDVRVLSL